jgi:hypothetical protein
MQESGDERFDPQHQMPEFSDYGNRGLLAGSQPDGAGRGWSMQQQGMHGKL